MNDALAMDLTSKLVERMKATPFLVAIDGSDDIGLEEMNPVTTKIFDVNQHEIRYRFLDMRTIQGGTANEIFQKLNSVFTTSSISWQQCIGLSQLITLQSIWESSRGGGWGGGVHVKIFDMDARPIFLGLKFSQILFFWVGKFFSYFSGFCKISAICLGLTNFQLFFGSSNFCITHLNPLNEEHTVPKNKIIVAFHIYSNFDDHFILSHSIFWGLNFGAFYFFGFKFRVILFFWVVEICSRTSIPVKQMLVYPPSWGNHERYQDDGVKGEHLSLYNGMPMPYHPQHCHRW